MPIYPGKISTSFVELALAIAEWEVSQLYISQVWNCRPSQESQLFPRKGLSEVHPCAYAINPEAFPPERASLSAILHNHYAPSVKQLRMTVSALQLPLSESPSHSH